jgi:PKD repeat protein
MLNSYNGKLLRINSLTGEGISSNPFYSATESDSPKSKVWALGFRNPYRFSIKPGTGSNDPSLGDIGEIYVGDVGWGTYEELNIITAPGMNFGWPIFEGLEINIGTYTNTYAANNADNMDEPNPLGCQQYFKFGDLIKQATADESKTVYNPCNGSVPIGTHNRYVHRRPALEWKHFAVGTRVGIFDGNNADVAEIGSPESGVIGTAFPGNCSIGGFWYTGTLFPANFRNNYFLGDFGAQWIKSIKIDFTDVVQEVQDFGFDLGPESVVCMIENPIDGTLVYVHIGTSNNDGFVKSITYGGNQFPVVKFNADQIYGPSPVNVNFNGTTYTATDPDGNIANASYLWDFGDGSAPSTSANPTHTFLQSSPGAPTKYTVMLTVTDEGDPAKSSTDSIIISVNNTPPVVNITSPVKNSTYPVGPNFTYPLTATVTDGQHAPGQLKYAWQTILRHNNHQHAEAIDTTRNSSATITTPGCGGSDTYYYITKLTVTDAAGLSTTDSSKIFPACASGTLNGSVTLQGHPVGQWNIPLQVNLYTSGVNPTLVNTYNVTTATNGNFSISNIPAGTYKIAVKNSHMLQKVLTGQQIADGGTLTANFGTLKGGDVNNTNIINLADLGALLSSYNKTTGDTGYLTNADLNGNGIVNLADLGLLLFNYNTAGESP